jgi:hypothetical protein
MKTKKQIKEQIAWLRASIADEAINGTKGNMLLKEMTAEKKALLWVLRKQP